MKLKTSMVTASQPPHTNSAVRVESVRAVLRVSHSPAMPRMIAAGISHATWPPISALNMRPIPVSPHIPPPGPPAAPAPVAPPPGTTLPVSLPVSRPRPLYPNTSSMIEFVCDPPMYGRMSAGMSSTMAIHHPADAISAIPAASSCRKRVRIRVGATIK